MRGKLGAAGKEVGGWDTWALALVLPPRCCVALGLNLSGYQCSLDTEGRGSRGVRVLFKLCHPWLIGLP